MIRKLKNGQYRLYSRRKDPSTGKRRNLGTFRTRSAAERHEREIQYFKRLRKPDHTAWPKLPCHFGAFTGDQRRLIVELAQTPSVAQPPKSLPTSFLRNDVSDYSHRPSESTCSHNSIAPHLPR